MVTPLMISAHRGYDKLMQLLFVGTTLACSDIRGNAGPQNRICWICGMKPGFLIRAIGIRSEGIKELKSAQW